MTTYNENALAIVGTEEQMASVMWQMAANAASASENEARRRMQIPHGIAATQTALRMLYNCDGPVHALSPESRAYVTSEFPSFRVAREGSLITWVTSCYTGGGFFSDALPDLITTLPDMRIGVAEIHRYEGDDMVYAHPFNINGKDGLVRCGAVEDMEDPDESYYADDEGVDLGELEDWMRSWPLDGLPEGGPADIAGRLALEEFFRIYVE